MYTTKDANDDLKSTQTHLILSIEIVRTLSTHKCVLIYDLKLIDLEARRRQKQKLQSVVRPLKLMSRFRLMFYVLKNTFTLGSIQFALTQNSLLTHFLTFFVAGGNRQTHPHNDDVTVSSPVPPMLQPETINRKVFNDPNVEYVMPKKVLVRSGPDDLLLDEEKNSSGLSTGKS